MKRDLLKRQKRPIIKAKETLLTLTYLTAAQDAHAQRVGSTHEVELAAIIPRHFAAQATRLVRATLEPDRFRV